LISATAEFQLSSDLVLINSDNVPVSGNQQLLRRWLHKLHQKTANYQAKDRSTLHCRPLGQRVFRAASTDIAQTNRPRQFSLEVDTAFICKLPHLKTILIIA
jgi:hypothetical protein